MAESVMGGNGTIVDLRALLAERFPSAAPPPGDFLATGLPAFDEPAGGGLRKGCITELISPHMSAGSASFIAALIHAAQCGRHFVALIDGSDSFDPEPLGNQALRHVLWVRCRTTANAIKSADLLLRDGNFPLVMIDLVLNPAKDVRKVPQTSWYRLQRLVEATSTAFLVLTRSNTVSSAHLKIVLENAWTVRSVETEDASSFLRIRVQRAHGSSYSTSNQAAG
jgi:hypothetical protein